ncbi:DNA-directed RNA polymerases I and III subunit RPAC2 isoform X2 [Narcine bancroftii]|uniref:DNA-directed RNA polymerases I and III subunit RPAC2 isoform X2 n=1 Tax=Narcine bancroftii TaxID=1343680 RepID=UPI0038317D59
MATVEGATKPVLEVVQAEGCDDTSVTFILHDEDHTLGNSLRYMIMKNPEVEFCGYSITHPSESKINFRIQTRGYSSLTSSSEKWMILIICEEFHLLILFVGDSMN